MTRAPARGPAGEPHAAAGARAVPCLAVRRVAQALVALLLVAACAGPAVSRQAPRVDGAFEEWSDPLQVRADARWIYLRFTLPERVTLQNAPYVVRVLIDADGDAATGRRFADTPPGLGPEVFVSFSSPNGSRRGRGARVRLVTPDGDEFPAAAAFGIVVAPTTSSRIFEMRIARRLEGLPQWGELLDAGPIRVGVIAGNAADRTAWRSPIVEFVPPTAASPVAPRAVLPQRPSDGLRVVSWNVLWGRPQADPEPFARVLRALAPDLILLQEWDRGKDTDLQQWFDKHAEGRWHVLRGAGFGVALVSRTPLQRLGPSRLLRPRGAGPDANRPDEAIRLVAARTQARLGSVAFASIHLRCCGYDGSREDDMRVAEVGAIRTALLDAGFASGTGLRLVGGDLNLVGSMRPLDALRRGLGPQGSDLRPADTRRLADTADYTWRNPQSAFTPGRLDWIAWAGEGFATASAFIFDSRALSPEVLRSSGVRAGDTDVSDHLPLVVDLRRD